MLHICLLTGSYRSARLVPGRGRITGCEHEFVLVDRINYDFNSYPPRPLLDAVS